MPFIHRDPEADLVFPVLSDLHMTHRGEGLQKLHQHLAMYSRVTPKIDLHVFAGDIIYQHDLSGGGVCDQVYPEPYDLLKIPIARYAKDVPLVYTIGNHENYPQGRSEPEIIEQARTLHESAGYPILTHKIIKGYHFITFGLTVSEEEEAWIKKEVRSALRSSGDRPVFVVYHYPLRNTVWGSGDRPTCSEDLRSFLLSSRRLINICGHVHTAAEHPLTVWQRKGGATVIHAPMAGVGYINCVGCNNSHLLTVYQSRSLFFEVKGRTVTVHKVDNLSEEEIGKPWVITLDGPQPYTDARVRRAKKPAFLPHTKIRAKQAAGGVDFLFPKALCSETAGNDDSAVPNYRFTFTRKGEQTPAKTVTWHSDYCCSHPGENFDDTVAVSLEKGEYTVTVAPVSFFGKVGRALRTTVKIGDPIAPRHNPNADACKDDVFAMI